MNSVTLRSDKKVLVDFDVDNTVVLTTGTRAAVRYLNLVGDRYLELLNGPGSTKILPAQGQIPVDRTAPALDLDLLLGGLKPVIQGLNPKDVNELTAALLQVFQGEGGTLQSLMSKTSSFSNTLADNNDTVEQLIDNLNTVLATLDKDGDKFSGALDRLQRWSPHSPTSVAPSGPRSTRWTTAPPRLPIYSTERADPGRHGRSAQPARADTPKRPGQAGHLPQRLPHNYKKLVRLGSYGSWIPYYLCELSLRVSDLQYRTVVVPIFKQMGGRCAEPKDVNE